MFFTSLTVTLIADTICVSGYGPVPAFSVFAASHFVARVASHADVAARFTTSPMQPTPAARLAQRVWCAACRALVPATSARDMRLGFRGYCVPCTDRLANRCIRENGRLPTEGHFFCPTCQPGTALHPLADLCPPERDGRRRLRCRHCRLEQLRARRNARRREGVGTPAGPTQHRGTRRRRRTP